MQSSKEPSLFVSFIPVIFLISMLVFNQQMFKDDATYGPNQLALLLSGMLTLSIGFLHLKVPYKKIEKHITESIGLSIQACLILLVVGSLISVWILSGIVPTMIYYGLKIINPSYFLPVACISCAMVALATGSSWSTTGTIGVALMGIGQALNIPIPMCAGAIISGAYFGDKMSPLSDTTNLAPAMAGTDLFTHIKHMTYTSG
ncbi:sodium:proton antiporter, partial [bacterium]|nr:sodium:proton antiporter [bacterium]